MIRVLQYLGGMGYGGTQAFLMEIYDKIDRDQVQFDIIANPREESSPYYQVFLEKGAKIYTCPRYNGKNHAEFCCWWNDFFTAHPEYHVLHTHIRGSASIFLPIAKKYGVTTVAHSHSTSNGKGIGGIVRRILEFPIRWQADWLFACSDKAGKWLYGKNALTKPNYKMIPNGIELQRFAFDAAKRAEMRTELRFAEDDFVLGHIGRFFVPKNHKFLVELFAEYAVKEPKAKLLLVGDGELFEAVQEQVKALGLAERVVMVGAKINTQDYYQAMDMFVFPSLWEGLGIAAIEAQANGLPCILSENIPDDVLLTNLAQKAALGEKESWILAIKQEKKKIRQGCTEEQYKQLLPFDSKKVAEELQAFYLREDQKARGK